MIFSGFIEKKRRKPQSSKSSSLSVFFAPHRNLQLNIKMNFFILLNKWKKSSGIERTNNLIFYHFALFIDTRIAA